VQVEVGEAQDARDPGRILAHYRWKKIPLCKRCSDAHEMEMMIVVLVGLVLAGVAGAVILFTLIV
jgi:hypothetical protein